MVETRKRLAHVPLLSLEQLRALPEPRPKEGGVYFLWRGDELVYVGRSQNVLWRVEIFRSNARYSRVSYYSAMPRMIFDRITLQKFELPSFEAFHYTTMDYEHAYIATYLPPYNADYQAAGNHT